MFKLNLKRLSVVFYVLFVLVFINCGRRSYRGGMKRYKKDAVVTVKGTVIEAYMKYNRHMREKGLHLTFKTQTDEYIVHVCPKWYADKKNITFAKDDKITVTGAVFMKHGEKNIYAARIINSEGSVLKLRDPDTGAVLWRGRYRDDDESGHRGRRRGGR